MVQSSNLPILSRLSTSASRFSKMLLTFAGLISTIWVVWTFGHHVWGWFATPAFLSQTLVYLVAAYFVFWGIIALIDYALAGFVLLTVETAAAYSEYLAPFPYQNEESHTSNIVSLADRIRNLRKETDDTDPTSEA